MAKEKDAPSPTTADGKRQAFAQVADALEPLSRADRLDVLRAVSTFYGLVVLMELPR